MTKLSITQKVSLALNGYAKTGEGYLIKCPQHGLVTTKPQGYANPIDLLADYLMVEVDGVPQKLLCPLCMGYEAQSPAATP